MPNLSNYEVGITIIVLLWVAKQLFDIVKAKKETPQLPMKQFECHAESKEVSSMKMTQNNDQHEKMIETLGTMNTALVLMNDNIKSTNGKAARIETTVNSIKQTINP